jgi:hypothetical protein
VTPDEQRIAALDEVNRLRAENTRLRTALTLLLDEIDSQYDDIGPGVFRAYSSAVEALGRSRAN